MKRAVLAWAVACSVVVVGTVVVLRLTTRTGAFIAPGGPPPSAHERADASHDPDADAASSGAHTERNGKENEEHGRQAAPIHVSRSADGNALIHIDPKTRERVGLRVEPIASSRQPPQVVAYGVLVEDPAQSFTLRAPVAGVLRTADSRDWPRLGEALSGNVTIGVIEPRLSPVEQLDAASRLATARADMSSAAAALEAARASYESKRQLRDRDKAVSDRAVEEADARVKTEEARLQAATETARLIESLRTTHEGSVGAPPLTVVPPGDVVEVLAQPGEVVESGQAILRVARFDRLLARVEVPAGARVDAAVLSARVTVIGQEDGVMEGEPIGPAPTVAARTQGQAYLLRVSPGALPVRPGTAVVAYLTLAGQEVGGVLVPRSAIVRYGGLAWVYVEAGDNQFERRNVTLYTPTEGGWFVTSGLTGDGRVVVTGAQVLLSEELKAQIESEQEAEE